MTFQEKRQSALQWWHTLSFEEKHYTTIKWLKEQGKSTWLRHPDHLTGREIEEMHSVEK